MHTSSGTLSSTALFPQPTGPEGNRPLPLAPDASRTRCFTPARSMSRLNASRSSSSVVVRTGVATSNREPARVTRRWRRAIDGDEADARGRGTERRRQSCGRAEVRAGAVAGIALAVVAISPSDARRGLCTPPAVVPIEGYHRRIPCAISETILFFAQFVSSSSSRDNSHWNRGAFARRAFRRRTRYFRRGYASTRTPRRARVERARASSVSSPGRARTNHTRCLADDRHALRTRSAFGSFAKPNNAEFSTTRRAASAVDAPSASSCTPRSSPRPTLRETEPTLRPR
jgi:hypothetical protein